MTQGVKIQAVLFVHVDSMRGCLLGGPGGENIFCYVMNIHVNQMFRMLFHKRS